MLNEVQKEKEDHAVEELLAGNVPLLVRCDADGEGHHKHSAADEGDAREDAEDEHETEDGFEERNDVAETEGETVWERGLCEVFGSRCGEGTYAIVDADETVAGKVDA